MGVNAGKPIGKNALILGALLLILYFANRNGFQKQIPQQGSEHPIVRDQSNIATNKVYDLLADEQLVYTKHAKERMTCRTISKQEVNNVLKNGTVNWQKSKKNDTPCPTYAIEGTTQDGQTVRIVFADCNNATKVVTAIDLKNNYACE